MKLPLFGAATLFLLCTVADAQTTLQVLDYGAAPRAAIRYQFKAAQNERGTMQMSLNGTIEVNGNTLPVLNMPPVKATMNLLVTDVAPDGSARLEFKTQSAEAPVDQVAGEANQAALNRTLAGLTLLSGWYRTDTRGRMLESGVSLPEGFLPAGAAQAMNQLMGQGNETLQQFPDEAVGPGARWQVVQRREVGGVAINMTQEFTLKSRSGNRIELAVSIATAADAAGSPAAAAAPTLAQSASGTMLIDLQKLVPTSSVEGSSSSTMTMQGQDGPQSAKITTRMSMSMAPATE